MNWKLKAHAMAILSRLPKGTALHHGLQRLAGTNPLEADELVRRSLDVLDLVSQAGSDPTRGVYVEIGTGWRPFLPFVLYLVGVDRVITLDANPWLDERYARETYRALAQALPTIAGAAQRPEGFVRRRYAEASTARGLGALLMACHVEYRCPADGGSTELPAGSIDFVCSSNVLEHLTPEMIRRIHRESFRILKPGGLAVHRCNPGDHYAFVDQSITEANFLRYPSEAWWWYGGSGLSYHNRLRCVQHRRLLEDAGFRTIVDRVRIPPRALTALQAGTIPLAPEFRGFTPEELAADYLWIVGQRQ
jgi:SAM-dependent methyltransferase